MARELKKVFVSGPTVKIAPYEENGIKREVAPGTKFVGIIKGKNETKFGDAVLFGVVDGNASVVTKNEQGLFIETAVKVGDDVTVFAGGQLKDKLGLAKPGEKIEIEYLGKKLNPKTGRRFNDFKVSVLD